MARRPNPLQRAAARAKISINRIQQQMSGTPAYQRENERAGVYFEPKSGREAARWSSGDDFERPNAKDLYFLFNIAGRYHGRKGIVVTVEGILSGDYPGHENEAYSTLSMRMNEKWYRDALENPANVTTTDIVNQMTLSYHGTIPDWEAVYKVSIIYEGV